MILTEQSWEWEQIPPDGIEVLKTLERAGRTCYKSEDRITLDSGRKFIKRIIKSGHMSIIEHINLSLRIITDRGVTHELVRHRLASYSQESTRYANYSKDKFGNQITCIRPVWYPDMPLGKYYVDSYGRLFCNNEFFEEKDLKKIIFIKSILYTEASYMKLLELGESPQQARGVLPNALKTEIVITTNIREFRHIFKLRTSKAAHPQIRELFISILNGFKKQFPVLFDDINPS